MLTKENPAFVQQPISEAKLNGVWERMLQLPTQRVIIQYTPFGGKMNDFSESALPFPHRPGVLYMINIAVVLDNDVRQRFQWIDLLPKAQELHMLIILILILVEEAQAMKKQVYGEESTSRTISIDWLK